MALLVAGLVAFVGLALDGGQVYMMRRQMQNAADAGAYAGGREMSIGSNQLAVRNKIYQYTVGNDGVGNGADTFDAVFLPSGAPVTALNVPPPPGDNCMKVTTTKTFQTLMISFLGFSTLTVSADATVCTGTLNSPSTGLWPVITFHQDFVYGQTYTLFDQEPNAPGNFGWADFNGGKNSSKELTRWLRNMYNGPFKTYATINCTGSSSTVQSLAAPVCIEGDTGIKSDQEEDARTQLGKDVTILIYDQVYGTGSNAKYHIIGFAQFTVTDVDFGGAEKKILGSFKQWALPGQIGGGAQDFGLKAVKLSSPTTPFNTPTPTPLPPTPTPNPNADSCGFTYTSGNPRTSIVFNESEVLRAFDPPPGGTATAGQTIKVWYNDEHALTLGVRQVNVKNPGGSIQTTNYAVTPLSTNPGSASNPDVGTTAMSGDQAGTDLSDRPMFPALFITDITNNPYSTAGDWQYGGTPLPPHAVFGTWKAAVKTIDKSKAGTTTVTVQPDADPAKNNWNLAGGDAPPAGTTDEGYGAEVRWNLDQLGLTPGHKYRFQFMVHDGDQNKQGGDTGEHCTTITMP